MTKIRVHKRNTMNVDLADLVEEISKMGLAEGLTKFYSKPFEDETKSIGSGPTFMQYLNNLFSIQIATGDIRQFESNNQDKYFMFSLTGTSDEMIKLQ
jgi:hypothetical protein